MTTDTNPRPETTTTAEIAPAPPEPIDDSLPPLPAEAIAQFRPRSRWAACVERAGDVNYSAIDKCFGFVEPCVIRTPADVLPGYAESLPGVWISSFTRDDGLRTGRAIIVHPDGRREYFTPRCGFVESATATPQGIVAVLAILSESMHKDLLMLEERGELAAAQICVLQRVYAIPTVSGWGLKIWTVQSTRAALVTLTSGSHGGQHVLRQLALDEPLRPQDLKPTAHRWAPRALHQNGAGAPVAADVNPGTVTPPTRSALGSVSVPYSIPGVGHGDTFLETFGIHHDLGFKPLAVIDTGNIAITANLSNITNTTFDLLLQNISASTVTGPATIYFF